VDGPDRAVAVPTLANHVETRTSVARWADYRTGSGRVDVGELPPMVRATLADTYRCELRRHILPAFGDKLLSAVTTAGLEDFRSLLTRPEADGGKGLKVKTARCIIDGTFRALYRDARETDHLVGNDPFAALRWPRLVKPEPDPFDEAERDRLLDYFWHKDRHYHASSTFSSGPACGRVRWSVYAAATSIFARAS